MMLSQSPVIFEGSIRDNLLIGFKFCEKPPVGDAKIQEAIKIVRLNKDMSLNASLLSGGEKQRLAMARVLLLEPNVFLLDEPSGQILGGASPVIAIEYQIAVMLGIVGSVSLTVLLFVQLGYKTFFNSRSQIKL